MTIGSGPTEPAPPVSVVVPAYNCEGFLAETLESVYAQTIAPAEVIVVNDGSIDGTERVLRQFAPRPGFRWITKENGGSASARNVGIRLATQRFIAFLDHDDLWFPEKTARHLDQFSAEPELALSFTAMTVAPYKRAEDGSLRPDPEANEVSDPRTFQPSAEEGVSYLYEPWNPAPETVLEKLMSQAVIGSLSTVMVRREAFDQVGGFNQQVDVVDDWLMWLQMAAAGMVFGHIPEVLVEHRRYEASLSNLRPKLWSEASQMFDEFVATNDLPRGTRKRLGIRRWCAHWHLITAIDELQAGNKGRARSHILRAARVHPRSVRLGWIRMLGIGSPPSGPP